MSKKLLLADDSITIQKVIQITFAHEDYELTITDNGDSALAMAKEIRPDLVMADVYMPGKNGYELASAIKQDPSLRHVPVLLLAGSFEPFDEEKARSCQADAWIEKPFESQGLIDKVAELLSTARPAHVAAEPVAVPEPVPATAASEEMTLDAFDEPIFESGMEAVNEDPFGDISFEEETPVTELESDPFAVADAAPVSAMNDWSDVAAEPDVAETFIEDTFATAEEPIPEVDDFIFEEEALPIAADFSTPEATAVAGSEFDTFDMDEEEIMPLGDDDILDEEDLEPVMEEQTLAAWSRDESEDAFADSLTDAPFAEIESEFVPSIEPVFVEDLGGAEPFAVDEPMMVEEPFFADESVTAQEPSFADEPAAEPVLPVESTPVFAEEPAPFAVAPSPTMVEEKAAAMSEDELEKIIEKVVSKVVEKLAGSILERVAWEVVPDLAENLIREEIRKIKDAAA